MTPGTSPRGTMRCGSGAQGMVPRGTAPGGTGRKAVTSRGTGCCGVLPPAADRRGLPFLIAMLALICCLACTVLAGCSEDTRGQNLIGTWTLQSMTVEEVPMDMTDTTSAGYSITLTINEDGTFVYRHSSGVTERGEWKASDEDNGTVSFQKYDLDARYADGQLTLRDGYGDTLVFSKVEVESEPAPEASTGTQAGSEAENG